jgi:hypothetical protein
MKKSLILALCALAGIASASNIVVNGDFSADSYTPGSWDEITTLTGWSIVGNDMAGIGVGYLGGTDQEIDVSGGHDQGGTGITQALATTVGQQYNLSFDVFTGGNLYTGGVDAYVGGAEVGSNLQGLTGSDLTADRVLYSYDFTATSMSTPITFMDNISTLGVVAQVGQVDVQAVPEPASFLGLGIPLLMVFRRRNKK